MTLLLQPIQTVSIPPRLSERLPGPRFIKLQPKGKIPVEKDWQNHPYSANDPSLVEWLNQGGNYGVLTGRGLTVVETDTEELKELCKKHLPETFTVQSPGSQGLHFYYQCDIKTIPLTDPADPKKNVAHIKGEGGQVVGPKSIHPNGGLYYIWRDAPIAKIEPGHLREIFAVYMKTQDIEEEAIQAAAEHKDCGIKITDVIDLKDFQRIGNSYLGPHPIHGSSTNHNLHVDPERNVWYCFRCSSGGGPLQWLAVREGIIKCEESKPGALHGEIFKQVMEAAKNHGLSLQNLVFTKKNIDEDSPNMAAVLSFLKGKYQFKAPRDTRQLYIHDPNIGIYVEAETIIRQEIEVLLGAKASDHFKAEVITHLIDSNYCDRSDFNKFTGEIPVLNGLLDLFSNQLREFTPEKIFTFRIQAAYDINADCPNFKKWLSEVQPQKEDQDLLLEKMGYCLYPDMPFHVMFFEEGPGRNGKGVYIRTLVSILGEHCSYVPLEYLDGSHRFAVANLYGSLMNYSSEPTSAKIFNTELVKRATGQDDLYGEIKQRQNPIKFRNIAKIFILGNRFPRIVDNTVSWWERIIIQPWNQTFTKEKGNQVQNIEQSWLKDETERSGILNLMLLGLNQLLTDKGFINTKSSQETRILFKRGSDPVGAWMEECCSKKASSIKSSADLWQCFKAYAEEKALFVVSENSFSRRLNEESGIKPCYVKIEGKKRRGFQGLEFKDTGTDGTDITHFTTG